MNTYRAQFTGRNLGAIGVSQAFDTTCQGDDIHAARLDLYNRFEHIEHLRLNMVPLTRGQDDNIVDQGSQAGS